MRQEGCVLRSCGSISAGALQAQADRYPHLRLGVKAIFFNPTLEVLLGKLPEGYPDRFNLPGGGIDEGEDLVVALFREASEEFHDFGLDLEQVRQSPVVAEGSLPFPRDGYRGKYEYLVAVPVPDLTTLVPKADSKIVLFPPMSWQAAADQVWGDSRVVLDQRVLYERGFKAIPQAARLRTA